MGTDIDIGGIGRDQKGIIAGGDVKNAKLISTGDVTGSYNAIGDGAQVIVNQAQSRIQELSEEAQEAERQLSQAIESYVQRLYEALQAPVDAEKPNPYKSLLSYELGDAPFFYGRDEAIDDLLDIIHQGRLTVLHADSGSGKSSLMKAGIASRLLAAGHLPLYVRPYDRPPALAIKQEFLSDVETFPELARLGQMSLRGFLDLVDQCLGSSTLYIVIDQFEEFFDELRQEEQKAFAAELAACLKQPGPDVRWVLSMRKEAFSDLNVFRPHIPAPYENDYFLKAFSIEEATEVIVEPARKQGVAYEEGLVEIILEDLRLERSQPLITSDTMSLDQDQPEARLAPPQVQLVCYTLFDEWRDAWRRDGIAPLITTDLYQKPRGSLGQKGAEGILNSHLSSVLERMKERERETARQILEALVTARPTRVILREEDLLNELTVQQTTIDEKLVQDVLDRLIDDRIISEIDRQGDTGYELAHDYLLSQIELDPATQARKAAQEMLNQEVAAWRNNNKLRIPADKLDIIDAQPQLRKDDDAKTLLRLSRQALRRRRRVQQVGIGTIISLIVLLLVVALFSGRRIVDANAKVAAALITQTAVIQEAEEELVNVEATKQAELDAAAAARAEVEQLNQQLRVLNLASEADSAIEHDPELAIRLAVAAVQAALETDEATRAEARKALFHAISSPYRATLDVSPEAAYMRAVVSPDGGRIVTVRNSRDDDRDYLILWDGASGDLVAELDEMGLSYQSAGLTFSPGGERMVVTGSADNTVYLLDGRSGELISALEGHADTIYSVGFDPDGKYIATADRGGMVRLWDSDLGTHLATIAAHSDVVSTVAFDPKGLRLISASWDGTARLWQVPSGRPLEPVFDHGNILHFAGFSPDGDQIYSTSIEGTIRVWDGESGAFLFALEEHGGSVKSLRYRPDGLQLVTLDNGNTARLWDTQTGELQYTLSGRIPDWIHAVSYSPDGSRLVIINSDNGAAIWDSVSGTTVAMLEGHQDAISGASFSHDGERIITAGYDGTAGIWDAWTGDLLAMLGHDKSVGSAEFAAQDATIVTANFYGKVQLWDGEVGAYPKILEHGGDISSAAFNHDGTRLVTASRDGTAAIWDTASGERLATLNHADSIHSAAYSPDGAAILTVGWDGARLWRASDGEFLLELAHRDSMRSGAFSPDGEYIVTSDDNGVVRIWDARTGETTFTSEAYTGFVELYAFSQDGTELVTIHNDGYLSSDNDYVARVWDLNTGELVAEQSSDLIATDQGSLSPDRERILTINSESFDDVVVQVVDVASGDIVTTLPGHGYWIGSAVFSKDGSRILTASGDLTARISDSETGDALFTITGHRAEVLSAAFSPDENVIATTSYDNTVRLWDGTTGVPLATLTGLTEYAYWSAFSPDGRMLAAAGGNRLLLWRVAPNALDELMEEARQRLKYAFTLQECRSYFGDDLESCPQTLDSLFPQSIFD